MVTNLLARGISVHIPNIPHWLESKVKKVGNSLPIPPLGRHDDFTQEDRNYVAREYPKQMPTLFEKSLMDIRSSLNPRGVAPIHHYGSFDVLCYELDEKKGLKEKSGMEWYHEALYDALFPGYKT